MRHEVAAKLDEQQSLNPFAPFLYMNHRLSEQLLQCLFETQIDTLFLAVVVLKLRNFQ